MPVSVPTFIKQAWAAVGTKFTIPDNANPTTGRAGWDQGFSPINLTPVAAGGIPPFGQDMNGVLYDITSAIQYIQAGRSFPYNQDFADSIGGYGKGSLVSLESDLSVVYKSKIDNNSIPPPGENWEVSGSVAQATESTAGIAKVSTADLLKSGVNNDSFATAKGLKDAGLWPIGFGQSIVTVTESRSIGATYTNTTGRAIAVYVVVTCGSSGGQIGLSINGSSDATLRWSGVNSGSTSVSAVIPAGVTYRLYQVAGSITLSEWSELR